MTTALLTTTLPPRVAVLPALPDQFEVRVDIEDIVLGQRRNGRECPIARATRRTLALMGHEMGVVIGSGHLGYASASVSCVSGRVAFYRLDSVGSDFVTAYDCSGNPPPCTVTLVRLGE